MLRLRSPSKLISKKNNQAGFTLIEVMIAAVILAIGILAVAAMQVSAVNGNNTARSFSEATTLAQDSIERIIRLDFTDAWIQDGDFHIPNVGADGQPPGRYTIDINYADSDLYGLVGTDPEDIVDDIKTIRVIVTWPDGVLTRRAVFNFIKARAFESSF